ncbi:MAG: SNF2 helicase-associated domain-containing protein [Burkholderiales bacterium]
MVDAGEIYHPLRWLPAEAYQFLTDISKLEAAGIIVRAPGTWQAGRPARPLVKASVGARPPSLLGKDALLDFSMEVTLDGERLSASEIKTLLSGSNGLQLIRGRWVEVDSRKLGRMLERFQAIEQAAADNGLPFAEAMRLVAGASLDDAGDSADADWSQLVAGPWLAETLQGLREPEGLAQVSPGPDRLRGLDRFAGRALARTAFQGRDGTYLYAEHRPLPCAEGNSIQLQLPGLGFHVQASRRRALWRGRAP